MIAAARDYLRRGLVPIPIGPDKRPFVKWESFQHEPPHADQVDAWWTRWPDANIGIITGAVSGLVALDADGPEGLETLKALQTPATTWLSRTGDGYHQWFQHPGVPIGNRVGLRPHLDVRGDGGCVIAPPSLHASGRRDEWLTPPERMALAPLPEHVVALLTAPPTAPPPLAGDPIGEGFRNDRLYRLARGLIQRGLTAGAVHVAVAEENRARCRPPLPDREVRDLVEHALRQPHRPDFTPVQARERTRASIERPQ
jgi:Bifunctional DNA primase/polymerase, N-terminal